MTVKHEINQNELKNSKRIFKSATPKYTLDWYIKWISSAILIVAISIRASGNPQLQFLDLILSTIGTLGWLITGLIWQDRAIIAVNAAAVIIMVSGIINQLWQ